MCYYEPLDKELRLWGRVMWIVLIAVILTVCVGMWRHEARRIRELNQTNIPAETLGMPETLATKEGG